MIRIELDGWYAVPKKRPRVTRNGTYMPHGYTDWKQETAYQMRKAWGQPPIEGTLGVAIELVARKRPRGDMDNLAGAVLDAGNGVLWVDDRQIAALSVAWLKPAEHSSEGINVEVALWDPQMRSCQDDR